MSYHLFLDDIRVPKGVHWVSLPSPAEPWVIARSFDEFVAIIQKQGLPDFISFDHDLDQEGAIEAEKTGMDCAKWLVDFCLDNNSTLPAFLAHSQNPPGRDNINGLLSSFREHQSRQKGSGLAP